jgi:hypothetical protein
VAIAEYGKQEAARVPDVIMPGAAHPRRDGRSAHISAAGRSTAQRLGAHQNEPTCAHRNGPSECAATSRGARFIHGAHRGAAHRGATVTSQAQQCAGGYLRTPWMNREGCLGDAAGKRPRRMTMGRFGPFVIRKVEFLRTADRMGAGRIDRNSGAAGRRGSRRAAAGRSDPRSARGGHRAARRRRQPARASNRRERRMALSGANGSRAFS